MSVVQASVPHSRQTIMNFPVRLGARAQTRAPDPRALGTRRRPAGVGLLDPLVVADHLVDDEVEELLRELRVEARVVRQGAQPLDLEGLAGRVGRRHPRAGLEPAHLLGALEALGEQVHQRGVEVVDAAAQSLQLGGGVLLGHTSIQARRRRPTPDRSDAWTGSQLRGGRGRSGRPGRCAAVRARAPSAPARPGP